MKTIKVLAVTFVIILYIAVITGLILWQHFGNVWFIHIWFAMLVGMTIPLVIKWFQNIKP